MTASTPLNRRQALLLTAMATAAAMQARPASADEPAPKKQLQVRKVLCLGNSITLHSPAPQIGWTGHWGMAASAKELDYVHQLLKHIEPSTATPPMVMVKNIADFERGFVDYKLTESLKPELEFEADLVVLAIGENVTALTTNELKDGYAKAFAMLLAEIKRHGSPTIFVRSCFWADATKDQIMQSATTAAGAVWVDMSQLGSDESNYARSERQIEHTGVAGHPGDKGMKAIADGLWSAIESQNSLWK